VYLSPRSGFNKKNPDLIAPGLGAREKFDIDSCLLSAAVGLSCQQRSLLRPIDIIFNQQIFLTGRLPGTGSHKGRWVCPLPSSIDLRGY